MRNAEKIALLGFCIQNTQIKTTLETARVLVATKELFLHPLMCDNEYSILELVFPDRFIYT